MSYEDDMEGDMNINKSKYEASYSVKFIIVGDSSVGKSNILLRFSRNEFDSGHQATLGIEFANKHVIHNNVDYLVQIWDTAGQENFRSVTRAYYKASAVAMVVYDITKEESFSHIQSWMKDCKELAPSTVLIALIGNKSDLEDQRVITKERGENLARENKMMFFETSALNGNGIENAFKKCIEKVDKKIRNGDYNLSNLDEMNKYGIKKIEIENENNNERIIDKKSLSIGKQKKKDDPCC